MSASHLLIRVFVVRLFRRKFVQSGPRKKSTNFRLNAELQTLTMIT